VPVDVVVASLVVEPLVVVVASLVVPEIVEVVVVATELEELV
jgi:hypothetical protein